jgi:hypothetical protein
VAMSTILARTTSRYGNMYLRARASSSCCCSAVSYRMYGSFWAWTPLTGESCVTEAPANQA